MARKGNLAGVGGVPDDLRDLFVTAMEVPPAQHVRIQAAFQRFTDNGVSKTVNLPHEATVDDVLGIFTLAFELGCKGITVYRYGCRDQLLYLGAGGGEKRAGTTTGTEREADAESAAETAAAAGGCSLCD